MNKFQEATERARARYPDKNVVMPNIPELQHYYESNERIEVDMYGDGQVIERGRVSLTMGWQPSFMLMRRVSDRGSSYLLDSRSKVLRVVAR